MRSSADISDLLMRVAARDKAAFAALYAATSAKLFGCVLRILHRRDVSEEVLQEVYVKIWDKAGDFDASRASPITWMCTIARNRALDEARRKQPQSLEDHPAYLETASQDESAIDGLMRAENGKALADCLSRLDPERAKMVVLAYCDGLSREDLGARYDQPVNTIKTWLRRALLQLRSCLDP